MKTRNHQGLLISVFTQDPTLGTGLIPHSSLRRDSGVGWVEC